MPKFFMPTDNPCAPGIQGNTFLMPSGGDPVACANESTFRQACGARLRRLQDHHVSADYLIPGGSWDTFNGAPINACDVVKADGQYFLVYSGERSLHMYDPITRSVTQREVDIAGNRVLDAAIVADRVGSQWDFYAFWEDTLPSGGSGGVARYSSDNLNLLTVFGGRYDGGQAVGYFPPKGAWDTDGNSLQRAHTWLMYGENQGIFWSADWVISPPTDINGVIDFPNQFRDDGFVPVDEHELAAQAIFYINPEGPYSFPGGDTITSSPHWWYPVPGSFVRSNNAARAALGRGGVSAINFIVDSRGNLWVMQEFTEAQIATNPELPGDPRKSRLLHLRTGGRTPESVEDWTIVKEWDEWSDQHSNRSDDKFGTNPHRDWSADAFGIGKDGFVYAFGYGCGVSKQETIVTKLNPDTLAIVEQKSLQYTYGWRGSRDGWPVTQSGVRVYCDPCGCFWLQGGRYDFETNKFTDEPYSWGIDNIVLYGYAAHASEAFDGHIFTSGRVSKNGTGDYTFEDPHNAEKGQPFNSDAWDGDVDSIKETVIDCTDCGCDLVDDGSYRFGVTDKVPYTYYRFTELLARPELDEDPSFFRNEMDPPATRFEWFGLTHELVATDGDFEVVAGLISGDSDQAIKFGSGTAPADIRLFEGPLSGAHQGAMGLVGQYTDYSIEAWVATTEESNTNADEAHGDYVITEFRNTDGAENCPFSLGMENDKVSLGRGDPVTGWQRVLSSSSINDGFPHHIVATIEQITNTTADWQIYIDGALDNSGTFTYSTATEAWLELDITQEASWTAGGRLLDNFGTGDPDSEWRGIVDEVAGYMRVLSASEVLDNYNRGSGLGQVVASPTYGLINGAGSSGNYTFSGGNLTVQKTANNGVWDAFLSDFALQKGRWYFEITVDVLTGEMRLGWAEAASLNNASYCGDTGSNGISSTTGTNYSNGTGSTFPFASNTWVQGDVLMFAFNVSGQPFSGGSLYHGVNGVWSGGWDGILDDGSGTVFGRTLLNGGLLPAGSMLNQSDQLTYNFGQSGFTYSVPAGYIPGWYSV